jgi:hypothetical protein
MVFVATLALLLSLLVQGSIVWALNRGYPSSGVSAVPMFLWILITGLYLGALCIFVISLPESKGDDTSKCQRFLNTIPSNTDRL